MNLCLVKLGQEMETRNKVITRCKDDEQFLHNTRKSHSKVSEIVRFTLKLNRTQAFRVVFVSISTLNKTLDEFVLNCCQLHISHCIIF